MENANANGANPYLVADEVKTQMGGGMVQPQEPANVETTRQAEDTAIKNEEKRPEAPAEQLKAEEGGDSKQNASNVINELGESRKKVLEKFIESAKKSGVAAEELKELISQDKNLEKTFKSKFGDDYDALMRGDFNKSETFIDEEERKKEFEGLKRKATLEAKLELMKEETERIKNKQIEVFAQANGLNSDELELVKENAEILSTKYEFEDALGKALLIVNRDKATASKPFTPPAGGNAKAPMQAIESTDPLFKAYQKHMPERNLEQVAQNIEEVNQRIQRDNRGGESFSVTL